MEIRKSRSEDLEEIITVLKASLGETDLPLSEEIWKFKHEDNPFGKSLVLLGIEDGKIIGVRAFMAWRWNLGKEEFSAYRAVDTATHPNHQGKGVFKKLTLAALEIAEQNNTSFIFNTPNDQSRPGYIKMGWKPVDKVKVAIKPVYSGILNYNKPVNDYIVEKKCNESALVSLCEEYNAELEARKSIFTPKSPDMLKWRYEENPLQSYEVFADGNSYIAGYVKNRNKLKELRISESLYLTKDGLKQIRKVIKLWSKKHHVQCISYAPELLDMGIAAAKGGFGPILTVRELNLSKTENEKIYNILNWNNSIGDLELF